MKNLHQSCKESHRKIPILDKFTYGIGNFSSGTSMQVISVFLVFYCTNILNISGSLVGIATSVGIIWDSITDPLMGYISDCTRSKRLGRRHIYLLIGSIGLSLSNFLLWSISPHWSYKVKILTLFFCLFAIKTFSTIYITPYTALGAELTTNYNERTSIQSIKTVFFLAGLSFASVAVLALFFKPTVEYPMGQDNPNSYPVMGLYTSLIILLLALVCFFFTKKYIPILNEHIEERPDKIKVSSMLKSFLEVLKNKNFRAVAFPYMYSNLVTALLTGLGMTVFTHVFLLTSGEISIILAVLLGFSVISQPFWTITSKRLDKKPALKQSLVICIIACCLFIILVILKNYIKGNFLVFLPFAAMAGFGIGGLMSLPLSMIADIIDTDELETGVRAEGTYYGCLTLLYKVGQSVAILLVGFLLDILLVTNFSSHTDEYIMGFVLSISSIIFFILAINSLKKYGLNKEKIAKVQKEIAKKGLNQNINKKDSTM
ncbi:MAG: MFS transporter [Clostridiales bacterium]|uniref:MFS transporter n=1 Tax=Clostridium sp. N3C TaxID=1776758 RepID=UPI00092E053E|nr:MFS transporter [Clostridium sp. N3C]NLZ49950.1 MFS transporter [Clostridiales bacterium]SCN22695.1 putative symporter YjmB [Clostridium sp. N3C]